MENINCLFCDTYKDGSEVEGENQHFFWRFDRYPVSPGHMLIIPKRHVVSVFELTSHEAMILRNARKRAKERIEKAELFDIYLDMFENPIDEKSKNFCKAAIGKLIRNPGIDKPDGYNLGVNEGEAAGRSVHHLHEHIIPRYEGDVENPRGGVRHIIPSRGNY